MFTNSAARGSRMSLVFFLHIVSWLGMYGEPATGQVWSFSSHRENSVQTLETMAAAFVAWIKNVVPAVADRHLEALGHLCALACGQRGLLKWPHRRADQQAENERIGQAIQGVLGKDVQVNCIHPLSLDPQSWIEPRYWMPKEVHHKLCATIIHHTSLVDLWNSFGDKLHARYFPRFRKVLDEARSQTLDNMVTAAFPMPVLMQAFGFQNAPWLTMYSTVIGLAGALLASENEVAEKFSDLAEVLSQRIILGNLKKAGREDEWMVLYR